MSNNKHWRLDLPSKSSRGSSRSGSRRHRDENKESYVADNAEQRDDDWKRPQDDRRSRPERSDRHREEESRRSRPRQEDRHRSEDSDRYPDEESRRSRPRQEDRYPDEEKRRSRPRQEDRYPDEESRRSRPRQEDRYPDVDDDWKRAEKNWKPPLERSDRYQDEDDGGRQRSGESRRSRPEYQEYHEYPEYSERQGRNSGKLPPRTSGKLPPRDDAFDAPARTSSPTNRRAPYDEPARTSSPSWSRSAFDEPEKTRSSLWGDESEELPLLSPLWDGNAVARRGRSRGNRSTGGAASAKPTAWWHLPNFKAPDDRRRSLIWSAAVGLLIVCCVLPSLTFVGAFAAYKHASTLATDGIAQLEQGGTLLKQLQSGKLEPSVSSEALQSFQKAYADFTQLQAALGLIGLAGGLPKYGGEIASAQQLVPLAVEASQMAVLGTSALNLLLEGVSNPFAKSGSGLSTADLQTIDSDFHQVVALFTTLKGQIQQLSPASLTFNAKLGADITKVKAQLPKAQQYIQLADTVLGLLPTLLGVGTPTNYLVEVLDSTELRPGGGFLGNYGVLTLSGGRLDGLKVTDVDLIDRTPAPGVPDGVPTAFIPFPPQYQWFANAEQQASWSLRDSNLEADFPTDARYAENNYQTEAESIYQNKLGPGPYNPPYQFQGVMAITPYLIQNILEIIGPIQMPAPYNQTVNSTNLIDSIHYAQLGPHHGSDVTDAPGTTTSQRKAFTAKLFEELMAKVVSLANTKREAFVKLALKSLQTKDVQIYLNSSQGEALLQKFNLTSTIEAPATGDSLFIVDANTVGNKQNEFIGLSATDDISIDELGNVTHNLTLTYNWPSSTASTNNNYGDWSEYTDHIRIYVPPKAWYVSTYGAWSYDGSQTGINLDFGREVFSGDLHIYYPSKDSIYLTWTVPSAAVKSGQTWSYQLLYQHQAGIVWAQNTQITLPLCAKVTKHTNKLKGGPNNTLTVTGPLTVDTTYAVDYTCAG